MAGAADRCVIPEHPFSLEHLAELLSTDRRNNPSRYSVTLVSEGATIAGDEEMTFEEGEADQFGHRKLGGIGERVANGLKRISPRFEGGRSVNVVSQRLAYLVRSGDPDALDSIVPTAFGHLAVDLIRRRELGRMVAVRDGVYDSVPVDVVTGSQKVVDVERHYDTDRLRPRYSGLMGEPLLISASSHA